MAKEWWQLLDEGFYIEVLDSKCPKGWWATIGFV